MTMAGMEALENWQLFESLRGYGVQQAREVGITTAEERRAAVRGTLNPPPPELPE